MLIPMIAGPDFGELETTILPTVGELNAGATELNIKINALDAELAAVVPSDTFKQQWERFRSDYYTWWNGWSTSYFFNSWRVRDELLVYRRRFNELLGAFAQMKGAESNVTPYSADEQTKLRPKEKGTLEQVEQIAKYGLYIGLVVGGAYALGKVTGLVQEFRR